MRENEVCKKERFEIENIQNGEREKLRNEKYGQMRNKNKW